MFRVQCEIIDLRVLQVGQLSKNAGLFILIDLVGKKGFFAVVSDVLEALDKHCITTTL